MIVLHCYTGRPFDFSIVDANGTDLIFRTDTQFNKTGKPVGGGLLVVAPASSDDATEVELPA